MGFCYKCSITIMMVAILLGLLPIIYDKLDSREFNRRTSAEEASKGNKLNGKTIIVTGSSSGIGIPTTKILVENGATVIMACRNLEKADKIRQTILSSIDTDKTIDDKNLDLMLLDLADLQSVSNFVDEFTAKYSSLNMLINNAGVGGVEEFQTTNNGIEMNFGVNHLAHFYLTQKLTPLLSATNGISRVINVASLGADILPGQAPRDIKSWLISDDKMNNQSIYALFQNYGFSKACNVIYGREYNKRYGNDVANGIYSVSLHPGWICTNLTRNMGITHTMMVNVICPLGRILGMAKTLNEGAATTIRVVSMSDKQFIEHGGKYFADCNQNDLWRTDLLEEGKNSDEIGQLLWDLSLNMLNKKGFKVE